MDAYKAWWQTPLALFLSISSLIPLTLVFGALVWLNKWGAQAYYGEQLGSWVDVVMRPVQYGGAAAMATYWPHRWLKSSNYVVANTVFATLTMLASIWIMRSGFAQPNEGVLALVERIGCGIALVLAPIWATRQMADARS